MIKRLDKSQYSKVIPLVRGFDMYLSVRAVLQENVEGFVYADDVMSPDTYFVWEISGDSGFYLEGEPSEGRALQTANACQRKRNLKSRGVMLSPNPLP